MQYHHKVSPIKAHEFNAVDKPTFNAVLPKHRVQLLHPTLKFQHKIHSTPRS